MQAQQAKVRRVWLGRCPLHPAHALSALAFTLALLGGGDSAYAQDDHKTFNLGDHLGGQRGKRCGRKRLLLCNGAERGCNITPPASEQTSLGCWHT